MLEVNGLCVKSGKTKILDNVSFAVKPHTVTAIIGRNAAGKSTLLSCFTGERKYTGTVSFSGKNLAMISPRERAMLISLLPQNLPSAEITVKELVSLGRTPYLDFGKRLSSEDKSQIEAALCDAGIKHLEEKPVNRISGGERQKAYLAMCLAQNTRLLVLDEPTAHIDACYEREFSRLLTELVRKKKKTALVVMHDLTRAVEIADNILILNEGSVAFFGSCQQAMESGIIEKVFSVSRYEAGGLTVYR